MIDLYFAIRRFFIIAFGGYTRYSDYPGFNAKVETELKKLRRERGRQTKEGEHDTR